MDRWTKAILVVIALGLWANALPQYINPAQADVNSYLRNIDFNITALALGACANRRLC